LILKSGKGIAGSNPDRAGVKVGQRYCFPVFSGQEGLWKMTTGLSIATPLQQILGTDKRNPVFSAFRDEGHEVVHVYYGAQLLESEYEPPKLEETNRRTTGGGELYCGSRHLQPALIRGGHRQSLEAHHHVGKGIQEYGVVE
jgi:hypothetical protein